MIKTKHSAGSLYISSIEAQTIESLLRILAAEDGYLIPTMFIGRQLSNREIDAMLLLPDALFLLDFKNWAGQRVEIEGINGKVRRLKDGAWEEQHNSLPNYEYAARELATRLKRERGWLPTPPRIYSLMVFTSIERDSAPQISFAGADPQRPAPRDGVGACRIEQLPQLIAAFRAASPANVQLNPIECANLANVLLTQVKAPAKPRQRRIEGYVVTAEHHVDPFLDCTIYLGEGDPIKEQVWIKEYKRVFSSPQQRPQRDQLVLRHADVLYRFPQHTNIVDYRLGKATDSHLYVILARKAGAFLSELLNGKPLGPTSAEDLQHIPFDLEARLLILGDLLKALAYLTRQTGFEQSAYRDLRPDSIFVQFTGSTPVAQLFNFDCTRIPGAATKLSHLRAGLKRFPIWDDYAAPELLAYIEAGQSTPGMALDFTGDVRCDLFSWGVIAWELLTGELPFSDAEAKQSGQRKRWPEQLEARLRTASSHLAPETMRLIEACLEVVPANRPNLTTLRNHFYK